MKRRIAALIVAGAVGAALVTFASVKFNEPAVEERSYAGTRAAPEFPAGLDWINTDGKPLTLASLRGKIVLLDFWTYGCVNCMHIIPDLQRLQETYARELVVVGVHSAKFEAESETANIAKITRRYGRTEPIVNDRGLEIWKSYGVRAWPTLMLIDPMGRGVGKVEGEGHYDTLHGIIGAMAQEFHEEIDPIPMHFATDTADVAATPLLFPGKVFADADGGRLFIADSNHGRIVVANLADGTVVKVIDGFRGPQGLTLADADTLYVADTVASTISRVSLPSGSVTRVAGTGERTYLYEDEYPDALGTGLNSPWDLQWHKGVLYVAMAGQHQLWTLDTQNGRLAAFAGTRREALRDGPRLAAAFNQPSGLAADDGVLFVADSEASAVRAIDLVSGAVTTPVGTGLFDFGDADGIGDAVRLQHPLGVEVHGGQVYLADTYNGKIKRLDPATRRVVTVVGGLDEPGGLSAAGGRLYIADTNNHEVKVLDLADGSLTTMDLKWPTSTNH